MKTLVYTGAILIGSMTLFACERGDRSGTTEREEAVVERDSVPTEYEVTETTVEYDTTRRTRTVDVDRDKDKDKDKDKKRDKYR